MSLIFNPLCAICAAAMGSVTCIKLVGFPKPKPMHRFSPNFQDMCIPSGSRADEVGGGGGGGGGVSSNNYCHGNTVKIFGSQICGCSTA